MLSAKNNFVYNNSICELSICMNIDKIDTRHISINEKINKLFMYINVHRTSNCKHETMRRIILTIRKFSNDDTLYMMNLMNALK